MNRSVDNIIKVCLLCILPMLAIGCGRRGELSNAIDVRDYVLEHLDGDSAVYITETYSYIDSLPMATQEDCRLLYSAVNRLTYAMHYAGDDAGAVIMLRHILDMLQQSDSRTVADTRQMLNMYVRLGATFTDMGMSGIGLDYYTAALDQCADTLYSDYKAMLYNNIGILYAEREVPGKAEEYFSKALDINIANGSHHGMSLNYSNLAELYALEGEMTKAQEASMQSLDHIDHNKYPERLAATRLLQGSIYARIGQYDVAMLRFGSALQQFRDIDDIAGEISATLQISDNFLNMERTDSAMVYARRALSLCRENGRDEDMAATMGTIARINAAEGDYGLAYDRMCDFNRISDSLRNKESHLRLSNREGLGPVLSASSGVARRQPAVLPWIIGGFLLLAAGGAYAAVVSVRQRCRRECEAMRAESDVCRESLDKVNRELTMQSLEKLKFHEGLVDVTETLRQVLLELNPKESAKRMRIRSLLGRLDTMSSFDADDEFKLSFERVHPDFYSVLGERCPSLTSRDLRLCAFLYLGMTTKEIAALTYREVRSVESARNRVRKKLSLDLADDLTEHIRSMFAGSRTVTE